MKEKGLDSVNSNLYVNDLKFNNIFVKHVKTKKRYEVEKIAQVCYYLFNINCFNFESICINLWIDENLF